MNLTELSRKESFGAEILFVSKEEKKILLLQRSDTGTYPNQWCLPGGMGDDNEPPKQTAVRECAEETGNLISPDKIFLINSKETYNPRFTFYTFLCIVQTPFKCKLSFEHSNYVWNDIDNLPSPLTPFLIALFKNKNAGMLVKHYIKEFS